ncbi:MAG: hypothetical protein ACO3RE_00605, partial [Ilumatobacteraceae bacterium]
MSVLGDLADERRPVALGHPVGGFDAFVGVDEREKLRVELGVVGVALGWGLGVGFGGLGHGVIF